MSTTLRLWYCDVCHIYFIRRTTWRRPNEHSAEHRPHGYGTPISHPTYNGAGERPDCKGSAYRVQRGPELAAFILGGPDAVYEMGRKVN